MSDAFSFHLALATLGLAHKLARLETDTDRQAKKERIVQKKAELIYEAFPQTVESLKGPAFAWNALPSTWERRDARRLLLELLFCEPFAPYEVRVKDKHRREGMLAVTSRLGLDETELKCLENTRKSAQKAHFHVAWGKVAALGLGGLVVLGMGGYLLAPAIGSALGAAAGLSGAAATGHGLALLGGGSLAAGGAGMAGGVTLVTGFAGATGGTLVGGGSLMMELGAARTKVELIKLQVAYRHDVLVLQGDLAKAQTVVSGLQNRRIELEERLREERGLNDKNAQRLKDIEALVDALKDAIDWMEDDH
ncbi:MAG: hypothetical protein VX899_08085 [Myxococcota bacterium]|nr:hypothetical protein [Myxococcota bacterium]